MNITATFSDPTGQFAAQADLMIQNAVAGLKFWQPVLADSAASIEIAFHLVTDYANRGGGRSLSSVTIGKDGPLTISDHGAVFELRTGIDANGDAPDIEVFFDAKFLAQHYWVNSLNGAVAPSGMNDLVQVIAHEMGHALGINGFRDYTTGQLQANFASPFDALVEIIGGKPFFMGPAAMAVYGGPVPLTYGNLYHVGYDEHDHADLAADLMNGMVFSYDNHYGISDLNVAVLSDIGVPTILSDTLRGTAQADRMNGGAGDDFIVAGAGDDALTGGVGSDTVQGDAGNDTVRGGQGHDLLHGGEGADWLAGDRGSDTLTGGSGADAFYIHVNSEHDLITDFSFADGDRLLLDAGQAYTFQQNANDAVLTLDGGATVTLAGVAGLPSDGWILSA